MIKITKTVWFLAVVLVVVGFHCKAQGADGSVIAEKVTEEGPKFEKDIIKTSSGKVEISFIGHGTLMFNFNDKIIHVDPVGRYADYTEMPRPTLF